MFAYIFFIFCFFFSSLYSEIIETFYGPIEVDEPVLLEIIKSPAMQRLKHIHQYGVSYYTTHCEDYDRYDHSIGVFAILRKNGASLEEQMAGILHDVSHTVFSHVGDWIFGKEYQDEDYQNMIHNIYLFNSGIEEILMKYGYTILQVQPKEFIMLEQPLPNLCADRMDYNLQGAYYQNFLTKEEVLELYEDFKFVEGHWVGTRIDLIKKLARFSLYMTQKCWGSASNYVLSRWLADAILKGLEIGVVSWKEIHFGFDDDVWDKLTHSQDPFIQERMFMVANSDHYFEPVDPKDADFFVKFKCRGIDPWVTWNGQTIRLSLMDSDFSKEMELVKKQAAEGWPITLLIPK
jgi:hypothetical protein